MKPLGTCVASIVIVALFIASGTARASSYQTMKQGTEAYQQGNYDESLSRFQEGRIESPDDPGVRFNLSSAQYQTNKLDEAAKGFEAIISQSNDPKLKQKAFYNLGNTAFRQGNFQASADNYRKALELDPSDLDAKQNLEFVLKKLEKKEQKKSDQDQQGEDKNEEQQPSESQQEQDQKGQQSSSQNPEENEDKKTQSAGSPEDQRQKDERGEIKEAGSKGDQEHGQEQKGEQAGKPLEPGAIAPEEAERLLNTLSDDQRAFLKEQAKRFAPKTRSKEKDW